MEENVTLILRGYLASRCGYLRTGIISSFSALSDTTQNPQANFRVSFCLEGSPCVWFFKTSPNTNSSRKFDVHTVWSVAILERPNDRLCTNDTWRTLQTMHGLWSASHKKTIKGPKSFECLRPLAQGTHVLRVCLLGVLACSFATRASRSRGQVQGARPLSLSARTSSIYSVGDRGSNTL